MAVYNEIGIGRWNRFIQKLTDIKGGPPARQLSSEIQFSHGIRSGAENFYLEGWDQFGTGFGIPANAGAASAAKWRNPIGSNIIAVFTKAVASGQLGNVYQIQYGVNQVADLATIATSGTGLDSRGRQQSTIIPSLSAAGAPTQLTPFGDVNVAGSFSPWDFLLDDEVAVPPGAAIEIVATTVNQAFRACVLWRERFLEPSERF